LMMSDGIISGGVMASETLSFPRPTSSSLQTLEKVAAIFHGRLSVTVQGSVESSSINRTTRFLLLTSL
jgi:hypothetical protein